MDIAELEIFSEKMNTASGKKTVSVFIPACNEEKNLEGAVESALRAVKGRTSDYEIIILDACSSDKTGEIADRLASTNEKIKVIHRGKWYGLGANYMAGAQQASMEYFVLFPGDNEITGDSLAQTIEKIGAADIIITYTQNTEVRALHRRVISKAFVLLLNKLFNLRLKYYNGNAVYKTEALKKIRIKSQDFAYNAEILIKLIKSGYSYHETGMIIKPITNKTAIFNLRNILGVIKTIGRLFYDVNIRNREKYQAPVNKREKQ